MITTKTEFTTKDYELTDKQVIHDGFLRYVHYSLRHRLFKGGWTPLLKREMIERTSAAGILPYDPVLDQVILISQFRPGTINHLNEAHISSPWVIEIVAGLIDADEKPEQVAVREAKEEAGCKVLELYPINDYFVSPGGSDEYIHIYCGRIDASGAGGIFGLEDDNEDICAFVLPAEDAFELLKQGKIKTAPAIIALQWLQINRHFLRDLWLKKS